MAVRMATKPPYTLDDLDHFPDDGCRYELIEGDLHVSAAPALAHQRALVNLTMLLGPLCTDEFELLPGPGVVLGPATYLEPDLCLTRSAETTGRRIDSPPLLVVEVLSPSTRRYDQHTKRVVYRDAGVGACWLIDPEDPALTVWRWEGEDETVATYTGDGRADLTWPVEVAIVPARLTVLGGWQA